MYKRTVDLHVHTDNSPDGNHSAMFICEKAELTKLRALAFCDHCEIDSFYQDKYDKRIRSAYYEVAMAQSAFRGKVLVLEGIELGQPHYDPELAEKVLAMREYDQVIGSVHNLRNTQDFYYMDSFTEWGNFDILAHLTYPLRYFYSKSGIIIDMSRYSKKVDEILKLTAEKGKALEVNSAGLRQPIKKLAPEADVVKRFKELGGKYVTFGSDAHSAEDLAAGLTEAYDAMKAAGFNEMTLFQQRTPLLMPIE